jgi:hypothetical protein
VRVSGLGLRGELLLGEGLKFRIGKNDYRCGFRFRIRRSVSRCQLGFTFERMLPARA